MTKDEAVEIIDQCRPLLESVQRLIERCEDTLRRPELFLVDDETTFTGEIHFEADFDLDD